MIEIPLGAIIAWDKSFTGTPSLPYGWAECNGQVLNFPGSSYHGQTMRDLNVNKKFLRGSDTSGTVAGSVCHEHSVALNTSADGATVLVTVGIMDQQVAAPCHFHTVVGQTGAAEATPIHMEVVYIMRVK